LKVFDAAGDFDSPSVVTEVASNLAHHGRHGERQELRAIVDVEAVDGVHQTESRSLDEIVEWFTPASVSPSDVIGERKTAFDNCVALTPESQRRFVKQFEMTEHLRHFQVVRCRLSHQYALSAPRSLCGWV
jgi:hypothetical protein